MYSCSTVVVTSFVTVKCELRQSKGSFFVVQNRYEPETGTGKVIVLLTLEAYTRSDDVPKLSIGPDGNATADGDGGSLGHGQRCSALNGLAELVGGRQLGSDEVRAAQLAVTVAAFRASALPTKPIDDVVVIGLLAVRADTAVEAGVGVAVDRIITLGLLVHGCRPASRQAEILAAHDTVGLKGQVVDNVIAAVGAVGSAVLLELAHGASDIRLGHRAVAAAAVADGNYGGVVVAVDTGIPLHVPTV